MLLARGHGHCNLLGAKNVATATLLKSRQFVEVTLQLPRSIPAKHRTTPGKAPSFPFARPHSDVLKDVSDMTEKRICVSMNLA